MSRLLVAQRALTVPAWAKDALWRRAQAIPSLDLRFADNKSLVDAVTGASLVTFARASSGTFVGSNGVLQTAATDAPRFDHNPTTGESLGLLMEEQRTNLLLNSGTLSTQSVTVAAFAHTLHFTGTGTITLTGTSTAGPLVGTGTGEANRASLTFTPTAGSLTLTVSGTVTNAQLENGAFPTSYIATTTAAATRSADVCSITGSAFTGWYNATQGTIYHQGSSPSGGNFFSIDDTTISNRITAYFGGVTGPRFFVSTLGVAQVDLTSSSIVAGSVFAQANTYLVNSFAISTNGGAAGTSSSGSVPAVNKLVIGANIFVGAIINGHLRRLCYWPQALPSRLQALTQ